MENQKLFDVMEHWLQGRINTCVSGLLWRVERLEDERSELFSRIEYMQSQINELLAALEPFATAYEPEARRIDQYGASQEMIGFLDRNTATPSMTMGDFRRAFEAISSVKGGAA